MLEDQKQKIRKFWKDHPDLLKLRGKQISKGQKIRYQNETPEKAEIRKKHRSEGVKNYYKNHPVTKEQCEQRSKIFKQYYKDHPEFCRKRGEHLHKYYLSHPEKCGHISEKIHLRNILHPKKHTKETKKKMSLSHVGLKHSYETRKKMSISKTKQLLQHPTARNKFRKDLGHRVRSSWEANFCRILKYFKEPYDYEKHTFKLNEIERYTPDIYLINQDIFIEVKGYLYSHGKLKIDKFREKYPEKKLIVVDTPIYKRLKEEYKPLIKKWEVD